jgi:hypothetical protein
MNCLVKKPEKVSIVLKGASFYFLTGLDYAGLQHTNTYTQVLWILIDSLRIRP